nr:hypothetical protein [Rhodoferax sp.]
MFGEQTGGDLVGPSTHSVGRATPATLRIGIKPADACIDAGAAQVGITQICAFEIGSTQISFA